jgi:hypothetical protein
MKNITLTFLLLVLIFAFKSDRDEEGMFLMSHLSSLDLKKAGLEIDVDEIYNEEKPALVNALVRLGGCTGSFISESGLIITNHHCVFSSIAGASSSENNYLENGFYAAKKDQEIKTTLPVRITQSYVDVSEIVLADISETTDALKKRDVISDNIKAIVEKEQAKYPNLTVEVSEMLVGKSYTLFRYKTLNDVRLVYVPPKNIGKFGGESDNWEWPRHNGDFSIVRAYENNMPYQPEAHLEVNPNGTKEGDFTFILGYPGTTYRNQTAEFLEYQNTFVLPIIADWFDFRIAAIEEFAGDNVDLQLKYSGRLASLNNTAKNFKGKMQGLRRTDVLAQTYQDQIKLAQYVASTKEMSSYLPIFKKNNELYMRKFELSRDFIYLNQLYGNGVFGGAAYTALYASKIAKMSKEEKASYLTESKAQIEKDLAGYKGISSIESMELKLFCELYFQLGQSSLPQIKEIFKSGNGSKDKESLYAAAKHIWYKSKLKNVESNAALMTKDLEKFLKTKDAFIAMGHKINGVFSEMQIEMNVLNAEIDALIPKFNDVEMAANGGSFMPDANGTLRFTYGYIKGYEPEDAIAFKPFTTIKGILEKAEGTDNPDYFLQEEFIKKLKQIEPADVLRHPTEKEVVVGMLYNMDTTGGNSGSPVMDSKGRLVGVNFDRAYTATINDYAWNESYSRSIGVDIRYVLYVMKYFGEADEVLAEMGVNL